jgi:hypothetical protein
MDALRVRTVRPPEQSMAAAAWITMIAVMAFVWGGFALAVTIAIRKESEKAD